MGEANAAVLRSYDDGEPKPSSQAIDSVIKYLTADTPAMSIKNGSCACGAARRDGKHGFELATAQEFPGKDIDFVTSLIPLGVQSATCNSPPAIRYIAV